MLFLLWFLSHWHTISAIFGDHDRGAWAQWPNRSYVGCIEITHCLYDFALCCVMWLRSFSIFDVAMGFSYIQTFFGTHCDILPAKHANHLTPPIISKRCLTVFQLRLHTQHICLTFLCFMAKWLFYLESMQPSLWVLCHAPTSWTYQGLTGPWTRYCSEGTKTVAGQSRNQRWFTCGWHISSHQYKYSSRCTLLNSSNS
jgi:hypothetical protein